MKGNSIKGAREERGVGEWKWCACRRSLVLLS